MKPAEIACRTQVISLIIRHLQFSRVHLLIGSLLVFGVFHPNTTPAATWASSHANPPAPERELRGAWIATVANIDWPSANNLSVAQQKAELVNMLDVAAAYRLNALFFQVRPACDALYASRIEPWSEYLTGVAGQAPEPRYDPLEFAVNEAHKRGLELHAWFNPYRARHPSAKSMVPQSHISRKKPQLVRTYARHLWLDPGEKEVQDYSLSVVMDVLRRYEVDGIHFDDYFYPYKERDTRGNALDFPDDSSWAKYGAGKGLSREDWRRENVNTFIRRVSDSVKREKPWVKFGVSPFGIWRPGNPPQIRGYDAYANLYADARKWLGSGWVDYLAPQLYWAIDPPAQSFPVLLDWWAKQNEQQKMLWPGLNTVNAAGKWPVSEIVNQIKLTRRSSTSSGHIHWNMRRGFMATNGLAQTLLREVYTQEALVPAAKGALSAAPAPPRLTVKQTRDWTRISWDTSSKSAPVKLWAVQWLANGKWQTDIVPRTQRTLLVNSAQPQVVSVRAVGQLGNLGPVTVQERSTRPERRR